MLSEAIASPGTSFGVLQGGLEGSLEGRRGVFHASGNLFRCFQKRIWDLLELLWELLRKTRGIKNGLRRPYARSYLKYM